MTIIDVIGTVAVLIILIPVMSAVVVFGIAAIAVQVGIVVAIGGYIIGIPYAIAFRVYKGRWPEY